MVSCRASERADAAERAAHVGDLNDAKYFAERLDIDAGVPEYLRSGKIGSPRSGEFAEKSGCDDAAESQAPGEADVPAGWSRGRRPKKSSESRSGGRHGLPRRSMRSARSRSQACASICSLARSASIAGLASPAICGFDSAWSQSRLS